MLGWIYMGIPRTVDDNWDEDMYPAKPKFATVEASWLLDTYRNVPNPTIVENSWLDEI